MGCTGLSKGRSAARRMALTPATAVRKVVKALSAEYGLPRHGNPKRPLDDLFYIVLSNKTSPTTARKIYRRLRKAFPSWDDIRPGDFERLRVILEPAGLGTIRARQIVGIVTRLRKAFGRATLNPLRAMDERSAEAFLTRLPGVSTKVAKCVMMYTLEYAVLPVDAHVHRISSRLGWVDRKRPDQCHEVLEHLVPRPLRYAYHVCCIAHGRSVCRPSNPDCGICVIREACGFYRTDAGKR